MYENPPEDLRQKEENPTKSGCSLAMLTNQALVRTSDIFFLF
jgi:hypothetical protein